MIKYVITAQFTLVDGTLLKTKTFLSKGKDRDEALNDASEQCDKIATQMTKDAGELVTYVYTGKETKDDKQIVGDNGIIEGPMSEFEVNERIFELIEEFPGTKFKIKEVK